MHSNAVAFILFPSFWFWVLFDCSAAILVAYGCIGEWYLHHHPAGRKKREKEAHHKQESTFIFSIALGVTMEIFVLGHSILEGVKLETKVSEANERASSNELQVAQLTQANLMLRSNIVALEVRSRWREITPEQKETFIKSTKNIGKFGIRIRFATHSAEVQSFATMVREMLDSAGFAETNVPPIEEWPPNMNILYRGGGEMPSLMFLNNVAITNTPVGPNTVFYVLATNAVIYADEFSAIIAQTNAFQMAVGNGDVAIILEKTNYVREIPSHSARQFLLISDPSVRKLWDFLKIRAVLYSMGITTEWMINTNLSEGTCEIFINPKL